MLDLEPIDWTQEQADLFARYDHASFPTEDPVGWTEWCWGRTDLDMTRLAVFLSHGDGTASSRGIVEQGRCGRWRWVAEGAQPGYWQPTIERALQRALRSIK
jgi:hypothetical protein